MNTISNSTQTLKQYHQTPKCSIKASRSDLLLVAMATENLAKRKGEFFKLRSRIIPLYIHCAVYILEVPIFQVAWQCGDFDSFNELWQRKLHEHDVGPMQQKCKELWDTQPVLSLSCSQQLTHPASLAEFNGLNYSSRLIHLSQHFNWGILLDKEQILLDFSIKKNKL